MIPPTTNWRKLPIEGSLVEEIVIQGYGKRWHVEIATREPERPLVIAMGESHLRMEASGNFTLEVAGCDDRDVIYRYQPAEELSLDLAEIDFPGDDRDWEGVLLAFASGDPEAISWVIPTLSLRVTPTFKVDLAAPDVGEAA